MLAVVVVLVAVAAACTGAHSNTAGNTSPPSTSVATARRRALAARYLAIATVGNRGLDRAFQGLDGPDRDHLVAAGADLLAAAAVERRFDRSLLAVGFPSAIEATARALVGANEARAALTSEAAASATLAQLRRYEPRLSAANRAVERQVKILRAQLGLPPPETS